MRIFGLLLLLGAAPAFGQAEQYTNPPLVLPPGVTERTDVVYSGSGAQALHLDLFLPASSSAPSSAMVFIHGGSWHDDPAMRRQFHRQAAALAADGFVGACIEYRDSRAAAYPAALDDARAAVRWLRRHAAQYHLDPAKILAAGGSAGGNLAVLLGTRPEPDSRVAAVVAFNPVLDLVPIREGNLKLALRDYLRSTYAERPERWREASPSYWADRNSAPLLILQGDADDTAPYAQAVDLVARLNFAGVRAELFTAAGAGHGFFNAPPWFDPTLARLRAFVAPWSPAKGQSPTTAPSAPAGP
jgi:acetyl esterase/lipase